MTDKIIPPSERKEPHIDGRSYQFPMEWFATSVGYMCQNYSILEFTATRLIQFISQLNFKQSEVVAEAAGNSLQSRCILVEKLAASSDLSMDLKKEIIHQCNNIMKNIIPKRNKYVHEMCNSELVPDSKNWGQISSKTKIIKDEHAIELETGRYTEANLQSAWDFVNEIHNAAFELGCLIHKILKERL